MKRLTLVALAVAGLSVPAATAHAAAPTCQGHRATIVGVPDQFVLNGTNHRDVIVTNGALQVRAGGGNDLICVTGPTYTAVEDGRGDDLVDARRSVGAFGDLSGGNDTFLGSGGYDRVRLKGGGRDRVITGGGADSVEVRRTSTRSALSLGAGHDLFIVRNPAGTHVDAGTGTDRMELDDSRSSDGKSYKLDNRSGRAMISGGVALSWSSFEKFHIELPDEARVAFTGAGLSEKVAFQHLGYEGTLDVDLKLGGGDDDVSVNGVAGGTINLGTGRDKLRIDSTSSVDADLGAGTVDTVRPHGLGTTHFEVAGVDDLSTTRVPFIELTGDDDGNRLTGSNVCTSVVHGSGGDDVIDVNAQRCTTDAEPAHALYGDSGKDDLDGTKVDDLLDGGPGNDIADGDAGTDVCLAETRSNCEGP